jgi:hypothetical protein
MEPTFTITDARFAEDDSMATVQFTPDTTWQITNWLFFFRVPRFHSRSKRTRPESCHPAERTTESKHGA